MTYSSSTFSMISLFSSMLIFRFSPCKNGNCESSASLVCTYIVFLPWLLFRILPDPCKVILSTYGITIYIVYVITILFQTLIHNRTVNLTMNKLNNHTHNKYECNYEKSCGFLSSDLEEFKDHIESHKNSTCDCGCGFKTGSLDFIRLHVESKDEAEQRQLMQQEHEEYIDSQAIENTQGLVRKDLLLEMTN